MAASADLSSLFREIAQEWQGEHGKAPTPEEFAEVTGLSTKEATEVLQELARPAKKPKRAAPKMKRPAAAPPACGPGGWETDMEPDEPSTMLDETELEQPDNQLGVYPEEGIPNGQPDEMDTQPADELQAPNPKVAENEKALDADSALHRGETTRLGWSRLHSILL